MKNNWVIVVLIVIAGILAGVGALFGISNAVEQAVMPIYDKAGQVVNAQAATNNAIAKLEAKLNVIDKKINALGGHLGVGGAPSARQQPPPEDLNKVYDIPEGKSVIIGNKNAPVTIVEFMDLQCPYCSRFYPMIKEALNAYPDTVRLIIKHYPLPFHSNAMPAAKLALAANEQGKYREMIEILLDNGADVSEPKVKDYIQKLGLDESKLKGDLENNGAAYSDLIAEDMRLTQSVEVRGTPSFFLNGKKTNARSPQEFKAEIEKLLVQK